MSHKAARNGFVEQNLTSGGVMSDSPAPENPTNPANVGGEVFDPDSSLHSANTRRAFLGGVGATSLGAILTCFSPAAQAATSVTNERLRIDTIKDAKTLSFETLPVPGGKEIFLDQQATGSNGVTMLTRGHTIRTDTEVAYTMHIDLTVQLFAPGASTTGTPDSTRTTNVSLSGIKGEVEGDIRRDHMTITIINPDGTSTRTSQEVPVRLDVSKYDDLTPEQLMRVMSEAHNSVGRLPF